MRKQRKIDEQGLLECSKCKTAKPLSEFNKDKVTPLGYSYQCRECHRATVAASYKTHHDKRIAERAVYREENRERIRSRDKRYYERNRDLFRGKYTPEIGKANKAVQTAVRSGVLPPQKSQYCVVCHKRANQYHHQSYLASDRLCVVPVCRSCHYHFNNGDYGETVKLGVFASRTGLIRIAIAR